MNVITLGTFDCLHPGHVHLFRECQRLAVADGAPWPGRVIAAVSTDEFVTRWKGAPPVQTFAERSAMVGAVRWVNEVQVNDGTDQADIILRSNARVIMIGDDWLPPRDYLGQLGITTDWLRRYNVQVRYLDRIGGLSSTELKRRIAGARHPLTVHAE